MRDRIKRELLIRIYGGMPTQSIKPEDRDEWDYLYLLYSRLVDTGYEGELLDELEQFFNKQINNDNN